MKIFAVIRNYDDDGADGSVFGEGEPTWYTLPDSSLLRSGNPFFVPDFDKNFHAFPSIVYRIGRLGKSIAKRFAPRYIEAWGMGVAVVATDLLKTLREAGLPWDEAVSFDRSCFLGNLEPIDTLINNNEAIKITCEGLETRYKTDCLRLPGHDIIEWLSRNNTLKNGDLILAGLMPVGLPLKPGTKFEAHHERLNTKYIDINIR